MNYTLMHQDLPVADLLIDETSGAIQKIGPIHNPAHLPIGTIWVTGADQGKPDRRKLNDWWLDRSIPPTRESLRASLPHLQVARATGLLTKSYGLSLSDQYWMCPVGQTLAWGDVNFFENEFSPDVGDVLFGYREGGEGISLMSPDNTTDGWLPKRWVIAGGKRALMKGGSGTYQQEPFNELIACAVMRRLTIPHVPYTLIFDRGLPYSLCETLVTPNTEIVPAWRVIQTLKQNNQDSDLTHLLRCAEALGIPNAPADIDKMIVLDYIIANTDRHYNNFGFVRDAGTLAWQGLAPIFDSGTALWHDAPVVGRGAKSQPFRKTHLEQIKLVKDFGWFNHVALDGIREECVEILSQSKYVDENRREGIARAVVNRGTDVARRFE